jgi:hypothetical protein
MNMNVKDEQPKGSTDEALRHFRLARNHSMELGGVCLM